MSQVLIIGGGFGGVWSAAAAARLRYEAGVLPDDLTITLVAPGDHMVIRPRLYEASPEDMCVPLDRILAPIGVHQVQAMVTEIDTAARTAVVQMADGTAAPLPYDRLVIAVGSELVRPDLPGAEFLYDIDTLPAAVALDTHLKNLATRPAGPGRFTAVVVGAGFTGLELSTELVGRLHAIADPIGAADEVEVILVERADVVGPELGPGPRPVIEKALAELGIRQRLGTTLAGLDSESVRLSDGTTIPTRTVAWTAGMRANPLTSAIPGQRDELGRLKVDSDLRVSGVEAVYAAGDVAAARVESNHRAMQSCQHAHAMGKHAGRNAAADLLGLPRVAFTPDPYVTCLDLGGAGAVFTSGWDRDVQSVGEPAKDLKRSINRLIYPPVDNAAEILRGADYQSESRVPQPTGTAAKTA
ncbi:FAD-dependent oxidoreductase [Micromonospora sp. NPDC047707]|uniref:NAD(P)/FAD-dependent oxidoreductase n=1 Tax=Micromonospora sp. NPDC047707 TaxID=3154498 RepID=UPI0034567FE8